MYDTYLLTYLLTTHLSTSKNERPGWQTYSGWFTHIRCQLAVGQAQDKESLLETSVLPLCHSTDPDGFRETHDFLYLIACSVILLLALKVPKIKLF